MAFVPSTIPAAKQGILDLLSASDTLSGVAIAWGHPGIDNLTYEDIFFSEEPEVTEEDRALGNRTRTETYTLTLYVCVYQPGNDAKACEVRCFTLAAAVEEAIRLNPRLGLDDPIQDAVITGVQPRNFIFDAGRSTEIDVRIQVKARKATN